MWNILHDGLLRERIPTRVELIFDVDDIAIIASATKKDKFKVERLFEEVAENIIDWLEDTGIHLIIHKSE